MINKLFKEFDEISEKQWKQKIQFELKGADYNETLVWKTREGIDVKPFYHSDDFDTVPLQPETHCNTWKAGQYVYAGNATIANKKAVNTLKRGAESILFRIPDENIDLNVLFNEIDLSQVPVYLEFDFLSPGFVSCLAEYFSGKNASVFLNIDPIGKLARSGNWFANAENDFKLLEDIIKITSAQNSIFKTTLGVDLSLYQNAGANINQQLAYTIAHLNEYLNRYSDISFLIKTALGSNYFFEIAKLRALQLLFDSLNAAYENKAGLHIIASPSKRNKTLYDYNVNMLRTTMECMSAVLGGANTVFNMPYDAIYHKDNEFGDRISRNQLLILKHESYFNKVANPADGSYYIESLTEQLAEKALLQFKQIEEDGGFLQQLLNHNIQKKVKAAAAVEQKQFDKKDEVLIGTNKYPNENDKMGHDLELYPFVKKRTTKTLIEPVIEKRLAEMYEQNRLKNE